MRSIFRDDWNEKSRLSVSFSDGTQLEFNDSSIPLLMENVFNPDRSRASTKVTLINGLVRFLVKFGPGNLPNFEVHTPTPSRRSRRTMFDFSYHKASHRLPRLDPRTQEPAALRKACSSGSR